MSSLGLKEKTEEMVKEKMKKDALNPFDEMLQKRKEKRKMKNKEKKAILKVCFLVSSSIPILINTLIIHCALPYYETLMKATKFKRKLSRLLISSTDENLC